ncbi:AAA family ATPase [uncultured Aquimarina sp.]|uniref:AAA family ATPase n=1 Tax=uncultured Aquimarina sp. TaxID=575652 RepID=UPI00263882B2|nr:AAA family ATPase [uncultured Aquimarina sp.]
MSTISNYQYSSPFKFLDAFEKDDYDTFFGRSKEVEKVFNYLRRTNLVVLFGPSGSGKSSLAQCGVANNSKNWKAIVIRRNENLITSFFNEIENLFKDESTELVRSIHIDYNCIIANSLKTTKDGEIVLEFDENDNYEYLKNIENKTRKLFSNVVYKPLFIFDQFEELFLFGDEKEINEFSLLLNLISKQVKFSDNLICIQSEFYAGLEKLGHLNPHIFDYKCEISDPNINNVKKIIRRTFRAFNINQVEDGQNHLPKTNSKRIKEDIQNNRVDKIVQQLSVDKKVYLPFLQIYLDKLYVEDFIRTYKDDEKLLLNPKEIRFNQKPLEFTLEEIESYGKISKILTDYIIDINRTVINRKNEIEGDKHKDSVIKFLKRLISKRGNKQPLKIIELEKKIKNEEKKILTIDDNEVLKSKIINDIWGDTKVDVDRSLGDIIGELIKARIVKREGNYIELSHNLLAKIVRKIKVDKDIFEYYKDHFNSAFDTYAEEKKRKIKKRTLLDRNLIKNIGHNINPFITGTNDDDERKQFWKKSRLALQRRKLFNTLGIVIGIGAIVVLAPILLAQNQELKKLILKALQMEATVAKKDEEENKIKKDIYDALGFEGNDNTKMYLKLSKIDAELKNKELLKDSEFPIFEMKYNELISSLEYRPFYFQKKEIDTNKINNIHSFKTRAFKGNNNFTTIFLNSNTKIYPLHLNFRSGIKTIDWKLLKEIEPVRSKARIFNFEPFQYENGFMILHSDKFGLHVNQLVLSESNEELVSRIKPFKLKYEGNPVFKGISLIEHIRDRKGNNTFLCWSDEDKQIHKVVVYKQDSILDSKIAIEKFRLIKDSIGSNEKLKDTILFNKSRIKFIEKISEDTVSIIANIDNKIPYFLTFSLPDNPGLQMKDFINFYDLTKLRSELSIEEIQDIKIDIGNKKKKDLYVAIDRSVYKLDLKNLATNDLIPKPIVTLNLKATINKIDVRNNKLIIGCKDGRVYIVDLEKASDDRMTKELIGHSDAVNNVSFINGTKYCITVGEEGDVTTWNISSFEEESTTIKNGIRLDYRKNKLHVGYKTSARDNISRAIRLFDSNLKEIGNEIKFKKRNSLLHLDLVDPNTSMIKTIINSNSKKLTPFLSSESINIEGEINDIKVVEDRVVIATNKGIYLNKSSNTNLDRIRPDLSFTSVDIHPYNSDLFIAGEKGGKVYLWNLIKNASKPEKYPGHSESVEDVCFSKDGKYFVSGSIDNEVKIWKENTTEKFDLDIENKSFDSYGIYDTLGDINDNIIELKFNQENILATLAEDNKVILYKINDKKNVKRKKVIRIPSVVKHDHKIISIALDENDFIYTLDIMGNIKKWGIGHKVKEKINERVHQFVQ